MNLTKNKCEIDVIVQVKIFTKDVRGTIIHLALMGFSISNLVFRFIIFSLIISITDKFFNLLLFVTHSLTRTETLNILQTRAISLFALSIATSTKSLNAFFTSGGVGNLYTYIYINYFLNE